MTYAVVTFGCRVNQADSFALEDGLRRRGAEPAHTDAADLVVVNTCSVTGAADQGARQAIRRIARTNPHAAIVVTGCYATRESLGLVALQGVVRVVPNDDKHRLLELIADRVPGARRSVPTPVMAGRTAYALRVQTGCDERCAFCIVPSTRGRSRSTPLPVVLNEVRRIVRLGFREVALTGVHLGAYGRDLVPKLTLFDLLRALENGLDGVQFRISSLEPMDCTPEIVDLVARSGRFAPHLHLPLQHASDRVLGLMARPYTLDAYRRLVTTIRERMPHAAIGCDVVAGFPGETDDDHEVLVQYVTGSPLTHLHVFRYSDRPGTAAAAMPGKVAGRTVNARAARLRMVGDALSSRFRRAQLGCVRPGLTLADGRLVVTDNYLKVRIPPGRARNERVNVLIESVSPEVRGRVVSGRWDTARAPARRTHRLSPPGS